MKKVLLVVAVLAAATLIGTSVAMASVVGTKHDMTTNFTTGTATMEVCVYCHTPHNANNTDGVALLWNRSLTIASGATYTPYSNNTIDGTVTNVVTNVTRLCLSCHDGTTSVVAMLNPPNSGGFIATGDAVNAGVNIAVATSTITGNAVLDMDFSNDHPIGISNFSADTGIAAVQGTGPFTIGATALPLYGTTAANATVECGSCHNVHDNTNAPFLRMSNAQSALCLNCHINK